HTRAERVVSSRSPVWTQVEVKRGRDSSLSLFPSVHFRLGRLKPGLQAAGSWPPCANSLSWRLSKNRRLAPTHTHTHTLTLLMSVAFATRGRAVRAPNSKPETRNSKRIRAARVSLLSRPKFS